MAGTSSRIPIIATVKYIVAAAVSSKYIVFKSHKQRYRFLCVV
jgi:hypothetical protein